MPPPVTELGSIVSPSGTVSTIVYARSSGVAFGWTVISYEIVSPIPAVSTDATFMTSSSNRWMSTGNDPMSPGVAGDEPRTAVPYHRSPASMAGSSQVTRMS